MLKKKKKKKGKKEKREKMPLCQIGFQLLHQREEKPPGFALGPKISALGKITGIICIRAQGQFLIISAGLTSRELRIPDICSDSLRRMEGFTTCTKPTQQNRSQCILHY